MTPLTKLLVLGLGAEQARGVARGNDKVELIGP